MRTYECWQGASPQCEDQRPHAIRKPPHNKLTEEERKAVLTVVNQSPYKNLPPSQIVPKLADKGCYIASKSTMHRLLPQEGQNQHRGKLQKPVSREPETHGATGSNQVWMWDITWLKGPVKDMFFYLYLILDLYSRKIVGWEIHDHESGENAKVLVEKAVWRERVIGQPLVLHSHNGSPMKAATLMTTLERLNVKSSYSRPRVSNDNAFVEHLFGAKYRPNYPSCGFEEVGDARKWVIQFVDWYNEEHQHRGIGYVTPDQRHRGEAGAILAHRRQVYEKARRANPNRWSKQIRADTFGGDLESSPGEETRSATPPSHCLSIQDSRRPRR